MSADIKTTTELESISVFSLKSKVLLLTIPVSTSSPVTVEKYQCQKIV